MYTRQHHQVKPAFIINIFYTHYAFQCPFPGLAPIYSTARRKGAQQTARLVTFICSAHLRECRQI